MEANTESIIWKEVTLPFIGPVGKELSSKESAAIILAVLLHGLMMDDFVNCAHVRIVGSRRLRLVRVNPCGKNIDM